MTGKEWLKQWLISKANECTELEQQACDRNDWYMSGVYTVVWVELTNKILSL